MKNLNKNIIINTSELGAGSRGSSTFYNALLNIAQTKENLTFNKVNKIEIKDKNELLGLEPETKFAKRIDLINDILKEASDTIFDNLKKYNFNLVLSADHSNALASISSLKKLANNKRIGVVWIDAHYDIHTPYTTPSGNVHGMTIGAALGLDNLQSQRNEIRSKTKDNWDIMKNIYDINPKIKFEDVCYIGVRDFEKEEEELINSNNIKSFTINDLRKIGAKDLANNVLNYFTDCEYIYISFDVDSLDPDLISYGTGTPVKNGIYLQEAIDLFDTFLDSPKVIISEIVEINPLLDDNNFTMLNTSLNLIEVILNKK